MTENDPSRYYTTYWNDFEEEIWESIPVGTGIIAEGGASGATLTRELENDDNMYMLVHATSSGQYRVSRLNLPDEALSGADVTFDWKPISEDNGRLGDIAFITSGKTHPYFGLKFTKRTRMEIFGGDLLYKLVKISLQAGQDQFG